MLGLIHSIPEMCASIISGSAGSSGSSFGSAMSAVAGAAVGAGGAVAGMAVGAAGVPAAVKAAAGAADAAGKTGLGKAASMAGMMMKAAGGAAIGQNANPENSFSGRFASKLSQSAMNSKMKNDG